MELTFLGTSSMVPTRDRNHTALHVDFGRFAFLFDCGEGTQRQLRIANLRLQKIAAVFISHWHGDHVLGLPGLIQTMAAQGYQGRLHIIGPKGTKERLGHLFDAYIFDKEIALEIKEIEKDGPVLRKEDIAVSAYLLVHGIDSYGFLVKEQDRRKIDAAAVRKLGIAGEAIGLLQRGKPVTHKKRKVLPDEVSKVVPGRRLGIIADTAISQNLLKVGKDVDLLVCESTYGGDLEDKAAEHQHLTASQAARAAAEAGARRLVLTHFSSRYKEVDALVAEARGIFPETIAAYDFMRLKV